MRVRLVVLTVIFLCLAPFLAAQILAANREKVASLERVQQSLKVSVERVQHFLQDVQADVENISENISISSAYQYASPEECHDHLLKIKNLYENIEHISILTSRELVYCSSVAGSAGIRVATSNMPIRSGRNNDTLWGEVEVSGISKTLVVPSVTAVGSQHDVDYYIVASLRLSTVLHKALELFDVPLAEAAIAERQGRVLASERLSSSQSFLDADLVRKTFDMPSGSVLENTSGAESFYLGVVKFPMNSSRFVFLSPVKDEYDRARHRLNGTILTALVETFILALMAMAFVEVLFIRNLRRIGAFATEVTAGHPIRRISIKSPLAEFKALVSALNLMVARLDDASRQDALTGIANRRALDGHLAFCDQQLAAGKGPFAVAMLDIDNFKLFNDRFGHAAGDRTLQKVGEALGRFTKRQGEMAARYGGEEFTLVLNDCDPERLSAHLEVVRREVEDLDIPHPDSPHRRVTVSIGYTVASAGTTMQQAIERADEALYRSKASGRNKVVVDEALHG